MTRFYVMTLFPELIEQVAKSSILGRAIGAGLLSVEAENIRDYTDDPHNHVDDYPYGGGAGMLMKAQPVYDCYRSIQKRTGEGARVVYLTPQGRTFTDKMAEEFACEEDLIFLCGHYEGIDERVLDMIVTDRVSIGDYVLTGGELPALVMIDAIARKIPGVLKEGSGDVESFRGNLLEYPQYTRPEEFMGLRVPEILLSGHHANIEKWRREQSIERTWRLRPDLLPSAELTKKEREFLKKLTEAEETEEKNKETEAEETKEEAE